MKKILVALLALLFAAGVALFAAGVAYGAKYGTTRVLANVTDGADGTYYYCQDAEAPYNYSSTQLVLNGGSGSVTVTIECTLVDDGTACGSIAAGDWEDITNDLYGQASFTASVVLVDNAQKLAACKYYRYKVVAATGAADDADWKIIRRWWML